MRFPNLIIVALTQYLLQYLVLVPEYSNYQSQFELDNLIVLKPFQFFFLVVSTICIAGGGYIINDIEDVEIDKINKPEKKQIVGRQISLRQAWILYLAITLTGFFISIYLANYIHHFEQLIIYPCGVLLLFAYSRWFKKMPLIGNLVVSFFCAFVAWVVLYAQLLVSPQVFQKYPSSRNIFIGYSIFAFLSTLFREIIKDMEDVAGDKAGNCKTLPILFGMSAAKVFAFTVAVLLLVAVYFFSQLIGLDFNNPTLRFYLIHLFISVPTLFALYKLYFAKDKKDFAFLSQFAKLIMLSGLIFILVMRL